jgi:glutamate synthase (NADPH/NADH) large chain
MSGGIAYVWDPNNDFISKCNLQTVELERVQDDDSRAELLELIELHEKHTGSTIAQKILDGWPQIVEQFVKVMPTDYKRVLMERQKHDEEIESSVHGVSASG